MKETIDWDLVFEKYFDLEYLYVYLHIFQFCQIIQYKNKILK